MLNANKVVRFFDQVLDEIENFVIVAFIFGLILVIAAFKWAAILAFVIKFFSLE